MKIFKIEILNYRSLKEVTIFPKNLLALIGRNNSGKSNVLKALQLFFDGGVKLVNEEVFYNHNIENPISITITFEDLSEWEKKQFAPWLEEERLIVGRKYSCSGTDTYTVTTLAIKSVPDVEWLVEDNINGENIKKWWSQRDSLRINGCDFVEFVGGTKPNVGTWKQKAKEFMEEYKYAIPFSLKEIENPKGYPGVLKGALPEFIYVPAVRDISDEAKVSRNNPFGQLINSILEKISQEQKDVISKGIKEVEKLLNRGSDDRIKEIREIENKLNQLINEIIDCDIEIEMALPKIKEVFGGASLYANDGVRTKIEAKGHGLQRSMIFTILRAYAELSHIIKAGEEAEQRSTIFAIEEPELYLHPQLQRTLMGVFRDISEGRDQIIYSTQSNLFISISNFDEICLMRREKKERVLQSAPFQLSIEDLIKDLKIRKGIEATERGIREQYSHVFDENINEGFFADKVVIVEGDSEKYSLPIYSKAVGYDLDRNNISIVHADGKGQMDRLLRIFNGFMIPTFLWFDGDKNNKDKEVREKTLELLKLLDYQLDSIDQLKTIVADNFAVLEEDYEKMMEQEIEKYNDLVESCKKEIGPSGKPLKHKYVATQLCSLIGDDGKSHRDLLPPTILSIIEKIKDLKYNGSILCKNE
ncbi:ATP-dependent endonuclease [Desulfothermus okinawensis JCM 13304]